MIDTRSEGLPDWKDVTQSEPLKFCVNCRHYRYARECPAGSQHRCDREEADLVTGKKAKVDAICDQERTRIVFVAGPDHRCGPEGKFFELMGK